MSPAHQVFLKQMVLLLIAEATILLNCLLAYPNPFPPKRCVLPLLMLVCISLKKILDISELGPENEQCFLPYTSSRYFVPCVLKIEKQRRIERIKQKRAQLQELLLQVKMLRCLSLSSLPVSASPLACFLLWVPLKGVSGTTEGSFPQASPLPSRGLSLSWFVSHQHQGPTAFTCPVGGILYNSLLWHLSLLWTETMRSVCVF